MNNSFETTVQEGKGFVASLKLSELSVRILLGNNKQQTFSPTFFIIMEHGKLWSSETPASLLTKEFRGGRGFKTLEN